MDFTKPEPAPHDAAFRRPLHQAKKTAEKVRFSDRADIGPYGRPYVRVLEALLVEYFTGVLEGDAEFRQMASDIFMDEVGTADVFARRCSHLPITPNMVAGVPPFVLFGAVQKPKPPVDHFWLNPRHGCACSYVNHTGIQSLPSGLEWRIETVQELACFIQLHLALARSARVSCSIVSSSRMAAVVSSRLSSVQKWPPGNPCSIEVMHCWSQHQLRHFHTPQERFEPFVSQFVAKRRETGKNAMLTILVASG